MVSMVAATTPPMNITAVERRTVKPELMNYCITSNLERHQDGINMYTVNTLLATPKNNYGQLHYISLVPTPIVSKITLRRLLGLVTTRHKSREYLYPVAPAQKVAGHFVRSFTACFTIRIYDSDNHAQIPMSRSIRIKI